MTEQDEAKKLRDELERAGLPGGRRGEVTQRAEILGVPVPTLKNWTTGRARVPSLLWRWLLAWGLLNAEGREEYRRRVREMRPKKPT